jgi:hypothetical protein
LMETTDEVAEGMEDLIERPLPAKKKSKLMWVLLIFIVLFAGAFFAARQFGGNIPELSGIDGGPADNNSVMASAPATAPAPPTAAPVNAAPVSAASVAVVEPDPLAIETPPVETAIQQPELPAVEATQPETALAPVVTVVPVIAETAVIPEAPQEASNPAFDMPKADVQPVENNSLTQTALNPESETVPDQSSEIKDALAKIEERLTVLEEQVQNATSVNPVADLQKDVDAIKISLQDLQKAGRERQDAKARSAAAADVRRGYGLPKYATQKLPSSSVKPSLSWRLRSAKPGKAWVTSVGSNEITLVQTGDNLPGLGKITAVAKDSISGRWFVQGTQGRIEQ